MVVFVQQEREIGGETTDDRRRTLGPKRVPPKTQLEESGQSGESVGTEEVKKVEVVPKVELDEFDEVDMVVESLELPVSNPPNDDEDDEGLNDMFSVLSKLLN